MEKIPIMVKEGGKLVFLPQKNKPSISMIKIDPERKGMTILFHRVADELIHQNKKCYFLNDRVRLRRS